MTEIAVPAAPAARTYTEDEVSALMKEKLAAEAKAASLIDKMDLVNKTSADQFAGLQLLREQAKKTQSQIDLLQKELDLMKSKYITKQTDW